MTERDLTGVMTRGAASAVPGQPRVSPRGLPAPALTRDRIVQALDETRGNKALAARLLGVSRGALYRQLERHGLHRSVSDATPARPAPTEPCL